MVIRLTRSTDGKRTRLNHIRRASHDELLLDGRDVITRIIHRKDATRTEDSSEVGQGRHVDLGLETVVRCSVTSTDPEVGTVHVEVTATREVSRHGALQGTATLGRGEGVTDPDVPKDVERTPSADDD